MGQSDQVVKDSTADILLKIPRRDRARAQRKRSIFFFGVDKIQFTVYRVSKRYWSVNKTELKLSHALARLSGAIPITD